MRKTIVESVAENAKLHSEKPAVIAGSVSLSYGQLYALVRKNAAALNSLGLKKGGIVVLRADQTTEYVAMYLAIHLAGGIVASLERNVSDGRIMEVAKHLHAQMILEDIVDGDTGILCVQRKQLQQCAGECDLIQEQPVFPCLEDSADILFTTGTTGASKGVELSHNALVATAENLLIGCGYGDNTFIIVPGPLNHANAIRKVFTSFVNGSTVYLLNGMLNLKSFFHALDYPGGVIACCLPPSAIRKLFQLTGDKLGEYANKIDFIESATSPLPEPDKLRLCSLLPGTRLYNNYGSSESASVCIYDYGRIKNKSGCIGKPTINAKIIIVDETHQEITSSKDRIGFIACSGDMNMKGYVNAPELTREVLEGNILYTNDLGYIDEDGYVYIVGRKGDVINVGGLKVAPNEVESAALAFPGIDDCICLPTQDPISGNALKLLFVWAGREKFDPIRFRKHMKESLEDYKIPRIFEITDKIERTYNGKLNRKFYLETKNES